MVDDPPHIQGFFTDPDHLSKEDTWWKSTKPPWVTSVAESMPDPKSRCLERLGEWGFVEAPRELFLLLGKDSVPALQKLARVGNPRLGDKDWPTPPAGSVRGNAQTILAKPGDQEQFDRIVKELDESAIYRDAIEKLHYVSSRESFEVLLHSLGLNTFPKDRYSAPDKTLHYFGEKLQKGLMTALSEMVVNPPLSPDAPATDANIQKWREW
jgi:hypothetical protein